MGGPELIGLIFKKEDSLIVKSVFFFVLLINFSVVVFYPGISLPVFCFISVSFLALTLALQTEPGLETISKNQMASIFGFFYIGVLPAVASRILDLPHGITWFFGLLSFVFGGDVAAYFAGRFFGKRKLSPMISPKKTIEGAIGGIIGSLIAGTIFSYLLSHQNPMKVFLVAIVSGILGQAGDLFESLLKRVANTKDSGRLMPGHGGVLDRLDGILFAAPVVYLGAAIFEGVI